MKIEELYDKHVNDPYNQKSLDIYEHLPILKKYAEKYNHITEMGTRWGSSTLAFLMGNPNKLISYDIVSTPEIEHIINLCNSSEYNFDFILGDTLTIEIEETDVLFIDTLHTYNQLKEELHRHSTKVRNHIILHDTISFRFTDEEIYSHASHIIKNSSKLKTGLFNAVKDFIFENKDWYIEKEYTNNNGLMILSRTKNLPKISAIVPTLWVNPEITLNLLQSLNNSNYISQIILIENKVIDIDLHFSKLQRYQQSENIFVNPAWNLGFLLSMNDKLLIINDDIHFDENLIKISLPHISPENGMIGIKTYNNEVTDKKDVIKIYDSILNLNYYGSLFFIHKKSYNMIPEKIKIFCGDLYLFYMSCKQNFLMTGFDYKNEGSQSSKDLVFLPTILEDIKEWETIKNNFFSKLIYEFEIDNDSVIFSSDKVTFDNSTKKLNYNFQGHKYVLLKITSDRSEILSDILQCDSDDPYYLKNLMENEKINLKFYSNI